MTLPWTSCRFDNAAAHVVGGGGGVTTSSGAEIDTTGADLLVMAIADYQAGPGLTISDSKANTWHPLTSYAVTGSSRIKLYWSVPTSVGSGHNFAGASGGGTYPALALAAFSGSNASPFDVEAGASGTSSTASAGSGITPSQGQELIIAAVSINANTASSINSSFIIPTEAPARAYVPGTAFGVAIAYKIQTAAAAVDPDWTLSGSADWAAAIASFKDL
jgi:hypothetical protein